MRERENGILQASVAACLSASVSVSIAPSNGRCALMARLRAHSCHTTASDCSTSTPLIYTSSRHISCFAEKTESTEKEGE